MVYVDMDGIGGPPRRLNKSSVRARMTRSPPLSQDQPAPTPAPAPATALDRRANGRLRGSAGRRGVPPRSSPPSSSVEDRATARREGGAGYAPASTTIPPRRPESRLGLLDINTPPGTSVGILKGTYKRQAAVVERMCPVRVWVKLLESDRVVCINQRSVEVTGYPSEGSDGHQSSRSGISPIPPVSSRLALDHSDIAHTDESDVPLSQFLNGEDHSRDRVPPSERSSVDHSPTPPSSRRERSGHSDSTDVLASLQLVTSESLQHHDEPDTTDLTWSDSPVRSSLSYEDDIPGLDPDVFSSQPSTEHTGSGRVADFGAAAVADAGVGTGNISTITGTQLDAMLRLVMREVEGLRPMAEIVDTMSVGVDSRTIDVLPTRTIQSVKDDLPAHLHTCEVCLEDYRTGDKRTTLPCLHGFHAGCIQRWLQERTSCPICRFDLEGSV